MNFEDRVNQQMQVLRVEIQDHFRTHPEDYRIKEDALRMISSHPEWSFAHACNVLMGRCVP